MRAVTKATRGGAKAMRAASNYTGSNYAGPAKRASNAAGALRGCPR